MLTQKRALELFSYDSETGVVISRVGVQRRSAGSIVGSKYRLKNGYMYLWVTVDRKQYVLARVIWLMQTGEWPNQVDHENQDPSDNRWKNLRNVIHQENSKNQSLSSANKSGRVGVHWNIKRRKWCAFIGVDGRTVGLGIYNEFGEAVAARQAAEVKYGFHVNHGKCRALRQLENRDVNN